MNRIFKVVWSKVKNCYVVASELAKSCVFFSKSQIITFGALAGCFIFLPIADASVYVQSLADIKTAYKFQSNGYVPDGTVQLTPEQYQQEFDNIFYIYGSTYENNVVTIPDNYKSDFLQSFNASYDINIDGGRFYIDRKSNDLYVVFKGTHKENGSLKYFYVSASALNNDLATIGESLPDVTEYYNKRSNTQNVGFNFTNPKTLDSTVIGQNSLGIGNVEVYGNQSIGIGKGVVIERYAGVPLTANLYYKDPVTGKTLRYDNSINYLLSVGSIAIGNNAKIVGDYATVIGTNAEARSRRSVAIGYDAQARSASSEDRGSTVAIGASTRAWGDLSVAIGDSASTRNAQPWAVAIGAKSYGGFLGATAIGYGAKSYGKNAMAIGRESVAGKNDSGEIRPGVDSTAISASGGFGAFSLGYRAAAIENGSMAFGYKATSLGENAIAIGSGIAPTGTGAEYYSVDNNMNYSFTGASGKKSIAMGFEAKAQVDNTIAMGAGAKAGQVLQYENDQYEGEDSGTEQYLYARYGNGAVAVGNDAYANANRSVALGDGAKVVGQVTETGDYENPYIMTLTDSVALGSDSFAVESKVLSVGHKAGDSYVDSDDITHTYEENLFRRVINVADGTDDHDVATYGQLKPTINGLSVENGKLNYTKVDGTNESIDLPTKSYTGGRGIQVNNDGEISTKNVLMYDTDVNDTASLAGNSGTKLTNLKNATLSRTSTDAVTGSQLYATNQNIEGFANDINRNKTNIQNLNTSVTAALESVSASSQLVDVINNTKADKSLNNLDASGLQVINNAAANAVQEYMANNRNIQNTTQENTRNVEPMLMRSAPLMRSVNPVPTDTNYVVYDDDTSNKITLEGENGTVIGNLANGVNNDEAVNVGQLSAVKSELEGRVKVTEDLLAGDWESLTVKEHLDSKADKSSVYTKTETDTLLSKKADKTYVNEQLSLKADKNSVYTKTETDVLLNEKADVTYVDTEFKSVRDEMSLKADKTYVDEEVSLKANKDSVYTKTESDELFVGKDVFRDALDNKADNDGSNIDIKTWSEKLSVGNVAEGDTGLVNGGTVYEAIKESNMVTPDYLASTVRVANHPKYDYLDSVDISKSDGTSRVMRGVVTDPYDPTSATNVGYVDYVSQNIARHINNGFGTLNKKVNRVGANAAAMSALTPASFEGDEKWSLAASTGNYRGETAGAVGAFYRPTENVMMNIRGSFGNDENMVAAGVAISLNKGDVPGVTKQQLAKEVVVLKQGREQDRAIIVEQGKHLEAQANQLAKQADEIAELKEIVKELVNKKDK